VTDSNNLPLFRLLHFVRHCASPLLQEQSPRNREQLYLSGNRLEAYLWLHLGVDLGYFPRSESEAYVRAHEDLLLRNNEEFIRRGTDVDQRIVTLWDTALNTGKPLPAWGESSFALSGRFAGRFQSACMLSTDFARTGGRQLLPFLVFGAEQEWDEVLRSAPSSNLITTAFAEPETGAQETTSVWMANFMETLEHMAKFDLVFPPAQYDSGNDNAETEDQRRRAYEDTLELTRRVGLITRWRVNLWNAAQDRRFDRLAALLEKVVQNDLEICGLSRELNVKGVLERITQIKNSWKNRGGEASYRPRTVAVSR